MNSNEWINKRYDISEKHNHKETMMLDVEKPTGRITAVIGESGTGKTTLLRSWFDVQDVTFTLPLADKRTIFDHLLVILKDPEEVSSLLFSVGLSSVPMWKNTLNQISNGEKLRFEIAYKLASADEMIYIDEFTSMIDRQTAKNLCKNLEQLLIKYNKKVVLVTCHFDILDWLNVDMVVDTTAKKFLALDKPTQIGHMKWKSEAFQEICGECLAVITI